MLSPKIKIEYQEIGDEKLPLVVVDNFFMYASELVNAVSFRPFQLDKTFYPGVRSAAPNQYLQAVVELINSSLMEVFEFEYQNLLSIDSAYSVVTKRPEELTNLQKVPHYDRPQKAGIACVHYLFDSNKGFGGTSFYRHNSTGYEYINEDRLAPYRELLQEEIEGNSEALKGYIDEGNPLFTRYKSCDAHFNRALFYRGYSLHSGDIHKDHPFDAGPKDNRLTMTSFIKIKE